MYLLDMAIALIEALMRERSHLVNLPPEGASLDDIERDAIEQALERSHYSQKKAAKLLGITARVLNHKIHHQHGINIPGSRYREKPKENTGTKKK